MDGSVGDQNKTSNLIKRIIYHFSGFSHEKSGNLDFPKSLQGWLKAIEGRQRSVLPGRHGARPEHYDDAQMKNGLVYLRPARLAYVRVNGAYEHSIPLAWQKMLAWADKNGIKPQGERGYGLAHDDPNQVAAEKCRYDACIQLPVEFEDRASRDLGLIMLPAGAYTRLRKTGGYGKLRSEMAGFYASPCLSADIQLDTRRPIVTIYLDDPRRHSERELRADICVPVATKSMRDRLVTTQTA